VEPEAKVYKITTEVGGQIQRIAVQSGDSVRTGQLILELTQDAEAAALAQAQAAVTAKEAELAAIEASMEANKVKLENARTRAERTRRLVEKQAETRQNLDDQLAEVRTYEKEETRLQAQITQIKTAAAENRAKVKVAQVNLAKRRITAPANGQILTMDLTPGASVSAFATVAELAPAGFMSVLLEVDELFADKVRNGQQATIRLQGTVEAVATGTVVYTAPALKKKSLFAENAGDLEDRRVREVRIRLNEGHNLAVGSRVEAVIRL
jgi:multidrug resistance efflux pump